MRPLGASTPPKYLLSKGMVWKMSIVVNDEETGLSTPMLCQHRKSQSR
jgi:hypothetical protein